MANQEHLAKLKEGVEAWNEWKEENPDLQPDLQGAHLNFAQLQGSDLRGAFFDSATSLKEVILGDKKYGVASLADISWGGVNLAVVDWSPLKMLGDEYEARRPIFSDKTKKDKDIRLDEYRDAVRANRQLAVVLRDQGLNEEADHFAYRAQLCQQVVWRYQHKWLKYAFSWFLFLLAGYGYRPLRSLLWYLAVIFGFAIVYYTFGHITPLEAFVLSLTSFHGRGFFPGTNITLSDSRVVLAAFEAVVGLFIEISFIATFTQRFFGR